MSRLNLLDVTKLQGNDRVVGLIEAAIGKHPEIDAFPFRPITGTSYKTSLRTGLPTVGFRDANEGQAPSKSTFEQREVETFIFGGQIEIDAAVAEADGDGGVEEVKLREASGVALAALRAIGIQVWYGTTKDDKGFPGLKQATPFGAVTQNGDPFTINAGGSTVQNASSVYAVKFGEKDVTLIGGNKTTLKLRDWALQQITNPDGKKLTAYVAALNAWIGLQVAHDNCVRRICNLTTQPGARLTDNFMADLMGAFPAGFEPDAIFMSRRSLGQLQASRTVALIGQGVIRPDQPFIAPLPTEYEDVPIFATDSIGDFDAIET
jgi:hypothetical protein